MGGTAKREEESNGNLSRDGRLLRGWVHWTPPLDLVQMAQECGRRAPGRKEAGAGDSSGLQEEIERVREEVRELIDHRQDSSLATHEAEGHDFGLGRLWRAVSHLASAVDRLSVRIALLELERQDSRGR